MDKSLPNNCLVSIITPVYNGAQFLRQAIDSILAQDYPYIEYIVIDDGSTDNTPQILADYSDRIVWFTHANMGQSATLNKGWSMSKGHLLAYLSADDILLPTAISELVNFLTQNKDILVAYPNCDLIDPYDRIIKKSVARPFNYEELVVEQECYIGPGAIFKRSVFEQVGGWKSDLRLAPDREFWLRVGLLGEIKMYPKSLAYYRMHNDSTSYFQTNLAAANEYIKVMEDYYFRPDLPINILEKKHIAFSRAHLVSSRIHLRGGRLGLCWQNLRKAFKFDPHLNVTKTLLMLGRTLISRTARKIIWNLTNLFSIKKLSCSEN